MLTSFVEPGDLSVEEDRREELLSWAALLAILLMLAGEAALLTTHLWVPLARATERVAEEEYAETYAAEEPPPTPATPTGVEPVPGPLEMQRRPSPWRWAAYGITVAAAALVVVALRRRIEGTTEPGRWLWVLLMGGLVVIWGLLAAWLMTRQAFMFEQIIDRPGVHGPAQL